MSDSEIPLPPPTFEFLVYSLKTQAELRLGLFPFPGEKEDELEPDLPSARHMIDILAMLADKTRGNLSPEEQRLLENSLTELRFRFVQVTEKTAKQRAEKEQAEKEKSAENKPGAQSDAAPAQGETSSSS